MSTGNYPVKKTGSADNERLQINKALESIFQVLSRADQWDQAVSWGDHSQEGYASALSELSAFADLGVPANLTLSTTLEKLPSGNETHSIEASWTKAGDSSIVYDLEIRECDPSTVVDQNSPSDIIANTTLYSIPIVSNDVQESIIKYRSFFEPDVRYFFRVRIRQNILVSNWSAFENITTSPSADIPPAPTSLTATSYIDAVKLTWDYAYVSNPDVAKIEILRDSAVIDDVPRPAKQYIDASLESGVTYDYQVRAVTFNGTNSVLSSTVSNQPVQSTVIIRAPSAPGARPDGSALKPGDRWVDTDQGNFPYVWSGTAWVAEYTQFPGSNLNNGTVSSSKFATDLTSDNYSAGTAGWKIERDTGDVEFNNITARGDIVTGINPSERVEITSGGDYRIWVGSGDKTDANGVFWVKGDGSVKIDKGAFGLGAEPNVGSTSAANTTNVTQTNNPLVATFSEFESNGQSVSVDVVFDHLARKVTSNSIPISCPVPSSNTTGFLALQRSLDNGSTWSGNLSTASFTIVATASYVEDPAPLYVCTQEARGTISRTLVDSAPVADGTNVRYRIVFSSWSSWFLASQVQVNEISASYTQ